MSRIKVGVQLAGILHGITGRSKYHLELDESASVVELLKKLVTFFSSEFRTILLDPELNDPRPNVIILINDRDINLFDGLNTKLTDGNVVTIIPVSHGG